MRQIADVNDPTIKDAKELIVWFDLEEKFKLINKSNCPRWESGNCKICPVMYNKTDGSPYKCINKVQNFETFKNHLAQAERTLGENIAFPVHYNQLPLPQFYRKYRRYGYLHDYAKKEEFYIFDIKANRFIKVKRVDIGKLYTNGKTCTYCPCSRKCTSSTNLLRHLQVLETKYYAFLIIDKEAQNDDRNKERLANFVKAVRNGSANYQTASFSGRSSFGDGFNSSLKRCAKIEFIPSDDESTDEEAMNNNNIHDIRIENNTHTDQIDESNDDDDLNDDNDLNANQESDNKAILKTMEESLKRNFEKMNEYIIQLKSKISSTSLTQGIIDNQESFTISKRTEEFIKKEKELTFHKKVNLTADQLDYLLKKYGVSDEYEICDADLSLTLQLKEINPNDQIRSNLSIANSSITNASIKNSSITNSLVKSSSFIRNSRYNSRLLNEHPAVDLANNDEEDEDASNDQVLQAFQNIECVLRNDDDSTNNDITNNETANNVTATNNVTTTNNDRRLKIVKNPEIRLVNGSNGQIRIESVIKRERNLDEHDEDTPDLSNFSKRIRTD